MSDQPKKQELPPLPELPFELGHVEALGWELGHRRTQLLAALSDNEAKAAQRDQHACNAVRLMHRAEAAEAKLKSVEGMLEEKLEKFLSSRRVYFYRGTDVDALLTRIREAVKGDK